ncbi:cell surface protein [Bifidobacterium sp. SO1]|nr:cell surface protein [Bifidobacterium sp. SO1]
MAGKTYILIGNEQQLRAIGVVKKVVGTTRTYAKVIGGTVYQVPQILKNTGTLVSPKLEWVDNGDESVAYAGDADLAVDQTLHNADFSDHDGGGILVGDKRIKYFVKDADGNRHDVTDQTYGPNTGLEYAPDQNYIIFRDIDLSSNAADPTNTNWTPLMFSGTMFGAVAADGAAAGDLWNMFDNNGTNNGVSVNSTAGKPTISKVVVDQPAGKLNVNDQQGIGFFATIASKTSITQINAEKGGLSSLGTVTVANLALSDVSVSNKATTAETDFSLIGLILTVVTAALKVLGLDLDGLVGAVKKDPSNFATGAFVGRVSGDVVIRDCDVRNASVSNVKAMTGGFVGYMEGATQYEFISKLLGSILDAVAALLNLIPFLGLGDLITFLEDLIGLDKLIPVGYYNPLIENSSVNGFKSDVTLGNDDSKYAGGFAGYLEGAIVTGSSVHSVQPFTVKAKEYAGGFAGLARNGEIGGLLQNLGVELLAVLRPQSLIEGSVMETSGGASVSADKYAGGFVGAMASSYAVNDEIGVKLNGPVTVTTTDSYAGGFTGNASIGWGLELGSEVDDGDSSSGGSSLLSNVKKVVSNLLEGKWLGQSNAGDLLSLVGVSPSHILGAQINSDGMTVTAGGSYAGGVLGAGSGTIIASSSADNLKQLSFWKHGTAPASPSEQAVRVIGLKTIQAASSYAGGVTGVVRPATVASLLGDTLGLNDIGDWLGKDDEFASFLLGDITVIGVDDETGLTVSAGEYYAGGIIGCASGGSAQDVNLTNLGSVTAKGSAGGFAGFTGPGDAVGASKVNLLGLIQISGLLSVAQYSSVTVNRSNVTGVTSGFTVKATGHNENNETNDYGAGGFYGRANSTKTIDSHVRALKAVTADTTTSDGIAGGFVGMSTTGGLAEAVDDSKDTSIFGSLISVDGLLGAVPYLIPSYLYTTVTYVNGGYVEADVAGGFAGDFQSGYLNHVTDAQRKDDATLDDEVAKAKAAPYAVINIDHVTGGAYAGGFGGRVVSGALASAGKGGLSILGKIGGVSISSLLSLAQVYVPFVLYAGVHTDEETFKAAGGVTDKNADYGLVVEARQLRDGDSNSGSAGGFAGYVSAAQISSSSVTQLRHTAVEAPKNLETTDADEIADTYLNDGKSSYAVDAARYAGGYIGRVDLGSAAGVGKSINILGGAINLTDLVSALNVIVSTIEESDVTGGVAGYSVRASTADHKKTDGKTADPLGSAGGFVGDLEGGHIQHSNAHEFVYIIGQVSAGGYAGVIQPGVAADVLGDGTVLKTLLNVDGTLSLFQDFVPTIRNSSTDAAICGGAVRAQASSDSTTRRGMAGGYVGRDRGGQIWGNSTKTWSSISGKTDISQQVAYAARIRSVYGQEIAGGYTGLMEAADTAEGGSLSVLGGLIKTDNIAGALSIVYPTEEHTKVTGPLRNASYDQWRTWVENIGKYGAYGKEFTDVAKAGAADVHDQDSLNKFLKDYVFGFNVVAGRGVFANAADEIKTCQTEADNNAKPEEKAEAKTKCYELGANLRDSGVAGGHVGLMRTGTITDGQSEDVRNVTAMRAAGGYAGTMESGTAATFGSVNILGLNLDLGQLLNVASVFVPVVKSSSVIGYRRGMRVSATGSDITHGAGNAGGYVGLAVGAQIWGDRDANGDELVKNAAASAAVGANVKNLRKVSGRNNVGGFVGAATSGSVADVDTNAASGFLNKVLDTVIGTPASLLQVLQATIVTIRGAHVFPDSDSWGYTVEGAYQDADGNTQYALNAGGFAGSLQAAILGDKDSAKGTGTEIETSKDPASLTVTGLRAVEGGQYAGGFFGLADISSVASVGGGNAATGTDVENGTNTNLLLSLLKLGNVGVLEAFRTFLYDGQVIGVTDGIQIKAHVSATSGMLDSKRFTGAAGGFGGGLINGSVKKSGVTNLNSVTGVNYVGGFIGHLGKSGTIAADNAQLGTSWLNLLGATAGVLDIWGSHVSDSSVSGIQSGYTVTATHDGAEYQKGTDAATGREVAGGFTGYADLARVKNSTVTGLKKVVSGELAGGFVGETKRAYLVNAQVNSVLLEVVLGIVNALVKLLYLDKAEDLGVINIGQWLKFLLPTTNVDKVFDLKVLADGELLYVNLFGLKIGVALSKADDENKQQTDVAIITIGDSVIKLPCNKDGIIKDNETESNLTVQLIKGNRTKVVSSSVQGIADGYDVFGGGATQGADGSGETGYAGGFVALNDEGLFENDDMTYADTIRGTAELVGPFSGATKLKSSYEFNDVYDLEGNTNTYHIYRDVPSTWSYALTKDRKQFTYGSHMDNVTKNGQTIDVTGALRLPLNRYDVAHLANEQDQWGKPVVVPYIKTFSDYEDAVMANNEGGVNDESENGTYKAKPLGVYVSPAQADLMLGKATADNNGGITPEPDDGQDACGLEGCGDVSLTLRKVWRDNAKNRPQGITVVLTATYTNKNGEKITPVSIRCSDADCNESAQPNPRTVTMTAAANASAWSNTWRMTIDGLPVGFLDKDDPNDGDTNGTFRYYTYTVQEATLIYSDGTNSTEKTPDEAGYSVATSYATEYDPSDKGTDENGTGKEYVATITNYIPGLPNTGGSGTQWIAMLALIILGLGTAWYLHDTGKTGARRKRGRHVA